MAADRLGLPGSQELRQFYLSGFVNNQTLAKQYQDIQNIDDEVQFYETLFKNYTTAKGLACGPGVIAKTTKEFVFAPFEALEGVATNLRELQKRYQLGILSNGLPSRHWEIKQSGLKPYFRNIIISTDHGAEKPLPAIYKIAAVKTGLQASSLALVDDQQSNIDGALAAGFGQAIFFTPAFWQPGPSTAP